MSSEVCPFCGKTYKRLKSHLPHCKAAASSGTRLTTQDDTASPRLPTAQGDETEQILFKKNKKASSAVFPLSQSLPSSASPPSTTKKKKQKLSEQIRTATMPPISQSPSQRASISKTNTKTSLRDLIEAAKPKQVPEVSQETTRPASGDLPSASTPFVGDPLSSSTTAQTQTKPNPYKDTVKDNAHASFVPTETKPKGASKKKTPKMKKASQPTTKETSSSVDPTVSDSSSRSCVRDSFLLDNEREIGDLSVNSGSGHLARITLQDVRATLGRANTKRQSSRPSILSQIEATDAPPAILTKGTREDVNTRLVTTKTLSDQLPSTWVQNTQLQPAPRESSKSIQAPLIPQRLNGSPRRELPASPAASLRSARLPSEASQAGRHPQALRHTLGHHTPGLPATPPAPARLQQLPSLHPPQARVETWRADDRVMTGRSQVRVGNPNTASDATQGTQRTLGQVRLRELPEWLVCRAPSRPRDVVEMVQRGWQWYYRRYIDVKRGSVGGLAMLLAGYCVLSYIWSYPHIKRDRWRRYH